MASSRTFTVFSGGTITLRWLFCNSSKVSIEATGLLCSVYNEQQIKIFEVPVSRENIGIYTASIDTFANDMSVGVYYVELSGVAQAQTIVQRDILLVRFLLQ